MLSSRLDLTVVRTIADIRPADWATLARGWPIELSFEWLAQEERRVAESQFYVLARRADGSLAGALVCYLFGDRATHTAYPVRNVLLDRPSYAALERRFGVERIDHVLRSVRRKESLLHPSLVWVAPSSYYPGLVWDLTSPRADVGHVFDVLSGGSSGSLGGSTSRSGRSSMSAPGTPVRRSGYVDAGTRVACWAPVRCCACRPGRSTSTWRRCRRNAAGK